MIILHTVVILRTQGDYAKKMFDQDQLNLSREKQLASDRSNRRLNTVIDPKAKELANEIAAFGFRGDVHRERIAEMDKKQREGTLRALFDRMFSKKKNESDTEGYKLKHGRGQEVNDELFTADDVAG